MVNTSWLHRTANSHPVRRRRSVKRFDLRNRVVIRFALAVSEPSQTRHGHDNNSDSYSEFGLLFHRGHLRSPYKCESYHRLRSRDVSIVTLSLLLRSNGCPSFSTNSPPSCALLSSSTTAAKSSETRTTRFGRNDPRNRLVLARTVAVKAQDRALFEQQLRAVIESDDPQAAADATALLQREDELFGRVEPLK